MSKVLALFSGGIDSTFMVWKSLKEGNDVTVLHNCIINNDSQTSKENKAVSEIIEELRNMAREDNRFGNISDSYFSMTFGIECGSSRFCQQIMWVTSLAIYLQDIGFNYDSIQYGLISGDDGLPYKDDLSKIFDDCLMMKGQEKFIGKLQFPLIKYCKAEIVDELPTRLLKLTSSCEADFPSKYCNNCHSCKKIKHAYNLSADADLNKLSKLNPNIDSDIDAKVEVAKSKEIIRKPEDSLQISMPKLMAAKCCGTCQSFSCEYGKQDGRCSFNNCFAANISYCDNYQHLSLN